MKNYRVSFDYEAENPINAVIYLLGLVQDPNLQEMKIDWLVTDLGTGEQSKLAYSVKELEAIARGNVKEFLDGLRG
jgi:hypothetical protein